jgi:hypothetical protein
MATVTWNGGDGTWEGTNWSTGAQPGILDQATDTSSGIITVGSADSVGGITLNNAAAVIDVVGSLTVGSAASGGFTPTIDGTAGVIRVEDFATLTAGNYLNSATGTVELAGQFSTYLWQGATSTQTVVFDSSGFDQSFLFTSNFGGHLQNFSSGDTITYSTVNTITSTTISQNKVAFFDSAGEHDILFDGNYNASNLTVSGNTISTSFIACYGAGTLIRTPDGDVPVESLAAGNLVRTASGRDRRVSWVGSRRIEHPEGDLRPIRLRAGCFGRGVPARDLVLSAEHAVFAEETLIPARALVDDVAVQIMEVDHVVYFHVELETHDVLLAEGLPCESYFDNDDDARFDNANDRPAREPMTELCAPLRTQGEAVDRVRALLRRRQAALPA